MAQRTLHADFTFNKTLPPFPNPSSVQRMNASLKKAASLGLHC